MARVNYRHNVLNITSIDDFLQVKGGCNNNIRDVYFIRAVGETKAIQKMIDDIDKQMDIEVSNNRVKYIRISSLPKINKIEDSDYYTELYEKWEEGYIGGFRNIILNSELKNAISCALSTVCDKYNIFGKIVSSSIIKNFAVKTLYRLDMLMSEVLKDWNEKSLIKVIADNVAKEREYLFYLFLTFISCDVLLIQNREDTEAANELLKYSKKLLLGPYGTATFKPYIRSASKTSVKKESFSTNTVISESANKKAVKVVIPPRPVGKNQGSAVNTPNIKPSQQQRAPENILNINSNIREEKSFEELAKLASSVVLIAMHNAEGEVIGTGSGIMIGKDGFILTNNHVASGGSFYSVRIEDDEKVYSTAELIKYNQLTDLAVIRINRVLKPIPVYKGEKELVRGQKVVAIGSPLGLFNSVSDGIISGFRNINNVDMIQFTAPISHGSSGGAVLNMYGEVIGISTAGIDSGQNINLAVGYENIRQFTNGFRSLD